MRIITGEFRGRVIKAVPGDNTRPTTDKVKETVFNRLGQYFDGGNALDLFAGSGNLGLEALSRGIEKCIFVDSNNQAIKIIKENIATLKVENRCEVYRVDAFVAMQKFSLQEKKFDLVFLDPPYGKISISELLESLSRLNLMNDNAVVMCEYSVGIEVEFETFGYTELKRGTYGTIEVLILDWMNKS